MFGNNNELIFYSKQVTKGYLGTCASMHITNKLCCLYVPKHFSFILHPAPRSVNGYGLIVEDV